MSCLLILPNQLFNISHKEIDVAHDIIIYEHPMFFTKYRYHKTKLAYHRATMRKYYSELEGIYKVKYIEFNDNIKYVLNQYKNIYIYDPTDYDVLKDLQKKIKKASRWTLFLFMQFL
jgi:deoxyribodipyrimidine photolyase-related protein